MSCCIEFLQFILCCYVKEDGEYERMNRKSEIYQFSPQTLSTPLVKQSNAYTDFNPHIQNSIDLLNLSEKSTSSHVPTRETRTKTSISTNLPQKLNASSVTTSVVANSATQNKNSVNNVHERATRISQPGSSLSPEPHRPSSKPTTMSLASSSSTNTQGKNNYLCAHKTSITPTVNSNSTTQYENTINKVNESASGFSQTLSSLPFKPHRPSSKPTIMPIAPSSSTTTQGKNNYVFVQGATSPTYAIPEDLKVLFKRNAVPPVLKKTVTPSTYKEYYETLLYAEDFYFEKWDGFTMKNVILQLHEAAIYKRGGNWNVNEESDEKIFVAFKMDSVPERRPFLLSRDFVSVSPSGKETASSFQGVIYRVVKSNLVLVEFEEDFHHQHNLWCKYDVKFSFNRVCLKRAHQAISAASDPLFQNFLFPDSMPGKKTPYIIEGPLSVKKKTCSSTTRGIVHETVLSKSGKVIRDTILKTLRTYPLCHILVCAPTNKTCDVITRSLQEEIPDIFRANAAFRELDGVPLEIVPNCRYKRECFSCPPLKELREFKVVVSTFMSAFRLHNEGVTSGHFSHIFLVDASSIIEPEAMVALANLADDTTKVVVSGKLGNHSGWVRSNIARRHGLMVSFFERIRKSKLYLSLDPKFITQLADSGNEGI